MGHPYAASANLKKCRAFFIVIHAGDVANTLVMSVEYRGPSSFSIRILLISRVSRFCRTRSSTHPAMISEGTRSVPRNRALSRLATCVNASWPNSSFRRQQNAHRNLRNHSFETFRWIADSVGPLSLLSLPFLYLADPSGSNTIANPKIISAKTTQLNSTIAVRREEKKKVKWWRN